MKQLKSTLVIIALSLPFIGLAQTSETDLLRKIFSTEKKALVENFLQLTGTDANAFWEHYNNYEAERKALGDQRIALIKDYAEKYSALTNDQATDLVNKAFKLRTNRNKLQEKYFKKIAKDVDPKIAAGFIQLEEYIQTAITFDLYDAIPFVGE